MEEVQNILKHKYFVVYAYGNVYKVFFFVVVPKMYSLSNTNNSKNESKIRITFNKHCTEKHDLSYLLRSAQISLSMHFYFR